MLGDVSYVDGLTHQPERLGETIARLATELEERGRAGAFSGDGPVFVGIGASHAAAAGAVWALRERGIDAARVSAGDVPLPFPATPARPVVAVSQSGRSSETLALLETVEPRRRFAVVNNSPSPIAVLAGRHVSLGNLPDSYASTIGFTATEVALGMLADVWAGGVLDAGWSGLAEQFRGVQEDAAAQIDVLAAPFDGAPSVDVVAAGPSLGTAEETALLLREVARIHATGTSTRQYLHGMMEAANDGVHLLFGDEREAAIGRTLAGAGHAVILVTTVDVARSAGLLSVTIPMVPPTQRVVLEAAVAQMLVRAVAERRGVDIETFVFHSDDTKVDT